ncbi:MAG: hypothetical protein DRQ61_09055 [Gammaproteobacteria bacterium]|nr:MAG: hypothetical protein DRQ61_09055 [Gammaproteobacteria bacterium]
MIDPGVIFSLTVPGAYAATYWPQGGDSVETIVLIDRDIQLFPGGYESGVAEKRTEVVLRFDHVGTVQRGDVITLPGETLTVEDEISNDRFAVKVTVK